MKKLLCFIIIWVFYAGGKAQSLNIAHHGYVDITYNIVSINSKSYYVERTGGKSADSVSVTGINSSGQIFFKKQLSYNNYNPPIKLIRTKDSQLALLGVSNACDYPSAAAKNYLVKLDTTGNFMFQSFIQYFSPSPYLEGLVDFTQHTDSSFYLVSDSMLYHYSKSGQFISRKNTGLIKLKSITALNNGNLLVNGKLDTVSVNAEITNAPSIVNQQNSGNQIIKFIQTPSNVLYGLTNNGIIESYSINLLPINSSTTTINPNILLKDFLIRNDSIFVTGTTLPLTQAIYGILNQNFNFILQSQSNYKRIFPTGITINNENNVRIITFGSSPSLSYVYFKGFYQLRINGTFVSNSDVGVSGISVNTSTIIGGGFGYYTALTNLNVTVKNYGLDTVKSFYLNRYWRQTICGFEMFHKLYKTSIAPGDSVTVIAQNVYIDNIPAPMPLNTIIYHKVCMFTTIPNASNDMDVYNDSGCDSLPFIRVVGIEENTMTQVNFKLFPNPFQNNISFECEEEINRIEIYNSLGVRAKVFDLHHKSFSFNSTELIPGIYFVKIITEKGSAFKKVFKE